MDYFHFLMMILLIIIIGRNRVKTYQWTKRKLLYTALATYILIAIVTFSIL